MKINYHGHDLEITYSVESKYMIYQLEIQIDGDWVFKTKQYLLPSELHVLKEHVETLPVALAWKFPHIQISWGVSALPSGWNVTELINIQRILDLIDDTNRQGVI